ncbi:MAG: nucleotidyl transferase AbiEii/AbiGii toxin family protein [Gammaproteobacteria bacterium]|nr:nucleotidyl transferase AbiEii/AbiGii toxin family protein [Gammaproteobacteria bacterium]MDE0443418.1 nucleotidyl transferase AbiEii/AbiGii toxin family protein [Gammaproteobacteria bacterium]
MTRQRVLRDVPASVRARLKDLARRQEVDFNLILDRYAAERFLYRLSASTEVDRFTLKGAALLRVWSEEELRPTRDIDFHAAGRDDHDAVRFSLAAICSVPCPDDGVFFDATTIRVDDIRQDQEYGGLRARIQGRLGQVRLPLQVDIGFGDAISPEREEQDYPTLLDLPVPRIWTYPRETLIAEKLEAMVSLGETNTRVKDLWDIACLARRFAFDGEALRTAVAETFRRRGTSVGREQPLALLPGFFEDATRVQRWEVLKRQVGADADAPARLEDAGEELRRFLGPVCASLIEGRPFTRVWPIGGTWR